MRLASLIAAVVLSVTAVTPGAAQDFLRANYAPGGRPTQLNVCGDSDRAVYRVERQPGAPTASGLQATVRLFRGMRAVGLDVARSSPGVSVVSLADPTRPVIALPNVSSASPSVEFALVLEARCGILDTIRVNNTVDVRDVIDLSYRAIGQPRSERETVDPYLAAISFPVFTLSTSLSESPVRAKQIVTRSVEVANGSFRGYADSVTYRLAQGPGASLRALRINGVARAFAKTVSASGDTLVSVRLAGADFAPNRQGGGAGNGDARFDPDERLVIEEDLYIVACGATRLARHAVDFGCDGSTCATTELLSSLPIGSGQPALSLARATPFPTARVGYCQAGELTVWVRNLGRESDPTFGQARDIAVSAIVDFAEPLAANGYRLTRVDVAGVPLPGLAAVTRLDTVAALASDPDGPGRGLEDYDGDGYYDDLAVLDSFPISIYFDFDCSQSQVFDRDDNCANDAATTLQAFAYYDDACGRRLDGSAPTLFTPRNLQDDFEQRTQPDAFAEGAPFAVELTFGRLVFDFANSCSAAAELQARVVLPQGVTIDPLTSSLDRNGPSMPLLGVSYAGDTAILRFSPAAEVALSGEYNLVLGLRADCSASLGATVFPTAVVYVCPDCACEHIWICEDLVGPWVHKTAPPCPLASLYPCPNGVQGTSFDISRTTLGFYDDAFTAPYAPRDANLKAAIPGDSVRITMGGLVGDGVVADSLGIVLYYLTPNQTADTAGLFLLGGGTLAWKDGSSWRTCAIPPTAHALESVDRETWQRFDVGNCLTANGWVVRPGDSLVFAGDFEINPAGPIASSYEFVEDLRGGFRAVDGGVETICDQFGDNFRVGKPLTVFGVPTNGDYPKGCTTAELDFRLTGVNRGYVDEFGSEYRRAARLDSIVLTFDTALLRGFDAVAVELSVAGHPGVGSGFYPVRPLSDFPDGRYVLRLDTLDHTAELVTNHAWLYNMRVSLTPNCSSVRSSATGDQFYGMRAEPYYRDRYYARDIGAGARVLPVAEDYPFVMTYEDPASLAVDQLTAAYQRITSDSSWVVVEVCNTSTAADAARGWLTFDGGTAVTVEGAWLIDDPNNAVPLTLVPYSGGLYAHTEGLKRVDGLSGSAQVCNLVRLKVRMRDCGIHSLRTAAGWACDATPPAGWTPAEDLACVDAEVLTTLEPIAPFLESDLIAQPAAAVDLCDEMTLEFQVNNARPGTAYGIAAGLHVPVGFAYVPGSSEVAYPPSAGFRPTAAEPVATDTTVRGLGLGFVDLAAILPELGQRGLPGFAAGAPTDSNRFVLRVRFRTDCNYRSGSIIYFDAVGAEACGAATNLAATESAALQITGAVPDGTHLFSVALDPASRVRVSAPASRIAVSAENVGTGPADADDSFEIALPPGVRYVANSTLTDAPAGYSAAEPTVSSMGAVTRLQYAMPLGLAPGERFAITFEVAPAVLSCDTRLDLALAAVRYTTATCVADASTCRIPSDVTAGGELLAEVPVGDEFVATFSTLRATCAGPGTERLELSVTLATTGFVFGGSPVEAALYYDATDDGVAGPGDELVFAQAIPTTAGATSVTFDYAGELSRDRLGHLILRIDSTGLPLCVPQEIAVPLAPLDNAGSVDLQTVCIDGGTSVGLGDPACSGGGDLLFTWSSLPGGFEILLSDVSVATPTLALSNPYTGPDTLRYILATERVGVGITRDTIAIVVSPGVSLAPGGSTTIAFGEQTILQPDVRSGRAPFSYAWSPAATLSGGSEAQPIASPSETTVYSLRVTDAYGCSATSEFEVVVGTPVIVTTAFVDTTICPDRVISLEVAGGATVTWTPDGSNPSGGGLDTLAGSSVEFDPAGESGVYRFLATVSDPRAPGITDTVTIRVEVAASAACRRACATPELRYEVIVNTPCAAATGSVEVAFGAGIEDYSLAWVDAGGDTVARQTLTLGGLRPGVYVLHARSLRDTVCDFSHAVYVSASDGPEPRFATTPASCGASDGSATIAPFAGSVIWPDGSTAFTRSDLPAGRYRVAVVSDEAPTCVRYFAIDIVDGTGLTLDYRIDRRPTCGRADGAVTLLASGGSGDYIFGWRGGRPQNDRLRAGAYVVEVIDRATGCRGTVAFALPDDVPGASVQIRDARTQRCAGSADGYVSYDLAVDPTAALPLDSIWLDERQDTVTNGTFRTGVYCLLLRDANGCMAGGACVELAPLAPPLQVDFDLVVACGIDDGAVTALVRNGRAPLTYRFDDGVAGSEARATGLAPGTHTVEIADANGCTVSVPFEIGVCTPCEATPAAGDTIRLASACDGTAALCIAGVATRANQLVIYADGARYAGTTEPCDYARTRLTYLLGVYDFNRAVAITWSVDGRASADTVTTLAEVVAFVQAADPAGEWVYDASTLALVGGRTDGRYAAITLQRAGSRVVSTIAYNERIEPLGLAIALSPGFHRVVVVDTVAACADTLYADVRCAPVDTMRIVVRVDSTERFCLPAIGLDSAGGLTVRDLCPDVRFANYLPRANDTCVAVVGTGVGEQTGCWVVCDARGHCDTTVVIVTVLPNPRTWRDTIYVGDTDALCLSTAEVGLPGARLSIESTCPGSAGTAVDFALDTLTACVDYAGLGVGAGTSCLRLCDEDGNCVDGTLVVTVLPRDGKYLAYDTIYVNETSRTCPPGVSNIALVAVPEALAEFAVDSTGACVVYRGLALGTDTVRLAGLSAGGSVFEGCVIVTVVPYDGGVVARADSICTARNAPLRFSVMANDSLFGGVTAFRIVEQPDPFDGTVVVNSDNSVTFTPAADVCARDVRFVYEVCNGNTGAPGGGCARAVVTVCVTCDALTIFTALSPNGDGLNETFYVAKIEEFPDNRLEVFNRWGNLVYAADGYRNDWDGSYYGSPLPDGAYFYILDVTAAGQTTTYNGYIELMR